jgi:hypothetical protein
MAGQGVSRRIVLAAGAGALAGGAAVAGAQWLGRGTPHQDLVRRWYALWDWQQTDWGPVDAMLTDDFTFSSAAGDDHISKAAFKEQCWKTQIGFIDRFEAEQVLGNGDDMLVLYTCRTRNGKALRNVEHLRIRGDKIASIECYFGEMSSFPSAVSKKV